MIDKRQFIGKYCDVETKDGVWRLGLLEGGKNREEKDIVEVSLDGWSANKNQKVCIHSSRIQPPRYFSKGYTGQVSFPLRNVNFDLAQISYIVNWLKLFHNFDFQNLPILEITNIFRCQMFILVDSILFNPWNLQTETIEDNLKKVESLFNNIVQICVLYLEKIPKFVTEISNSTYEKHSYLHSHSVSYLEASYEIFQTLKNIFGFSKRSEKFFSEYKDYIKINYVNDFIDLGCINLLNRLWKEFKPNKLFEDKFYLIANILQLNVNMFSRTSHQKLNKPAQFKYMTEILAFLFRENFQDIIVKQHDDPDVKSLIDTFVLFGRNNKTFVTDSIKFTSLLKSLNKYDSVFGDPSIKNLIKGAPRRVASHNSLNLQVASLGTKMNPKLFSTFLNKNNMETISENYKSNSNVNFNTNNNDYSLKLSEIENKLTKLEEKLVNPVQKKFNLGDYQRTSTAEITIMSAYKPKAEESVPDGLPRQVDYGNLYVNPTNSFIPVSDPYDEHVVLSHIESNLSNLKTVRKIIAWRKRILEISKNNGWIVGKILASKTFSKLEITDQDIIEANLLFLEKYNLLGKQSLEDFSLQSLNIDFKTILTEYEQGLIKSIEEA